MNFTLKIESLIYTRYCNLEIFKKHGLVDEVLGYLLNLTPELKYHKDSGVKKYSAANIFYISPSNFRVIVA